MKSKPLTYAIAIIILAIAAIFLITSNREDAGEDSSITNGYERDERDLPRSAARDSRSTNRANNPTANLEWEEKIDFVLGSDSISSEKATRSLLSITLDPKAPLSVRNDALEHALNLAEDKDFHTIQAIMGSGDKELPEQLVQTILDDTLNRSDTIQLTTALKIIPGKHTAIVEEAIELLEFHLEMELGDDIKKWNQAVATFIAEQNARPPSP